MPLRVCEGFGFEPGEIELAGRLVTDRFISMSMISKDGRYYNHEMVSFEKSALEWGKELFNYYSLSLTV